MNFHIHILIFIFLSVPIAAQILARSEIKNEEVPRQKERRMTIGVDEKDSREIIWVDLNPGRSQVTPSQDFISPLYTVRQATTPRPFEDSRRLMEPIDYEAQRTVMNYGGEFNDVIAQYSDSNPPEYSDENTHEHHDHMGRNLHQRLNLE